VGRGNDGEVQGAIGGAPERWGGIAGDRRGAGVMGKARVSQVGVRGDGWSAEVWAISGARA